jgi:UDP-N-acetylglucosamine 2-epimerase (non-hydrolysing)
MKAAPILKAIRQFNSSLDEWAEPIAPILVHTGQHYDAQMSDPFFADLQMPQPDVFLAAGSGSHAAQTAEIMKRFAPVLIEQAPDSLLVVGDLNSTAFRGMRQIPENGTVSPARGSCRFWPPN